MPASNVYRLGFAFQEGKGQIADQPQWLSAVTSAEIAPTMETEQRSETGLGRDVGDTYIRVLSSGGSASVLVRPGMAGLIMYGVMGGYSYEAPAAGADAGTHSFWPASDQPWMTVWRMFGDEDWSPNHRLIERFHDCKITGAQFTGEAGGDLTCGLTIMGLNFERLDAFPTGGFFDAGLPLRVPGAQYRAEGVLQDAYTTTNFNIQANQTQLQTTDVTYRYMEPSQREITAGYTEIYQEVLNYVRVHYDADGSPRTDPFAMSLDYTWRDPGNTASMTLGIPRFQVAASPLQPNSGGDPLTMEISGRAARPSDPAVRIANASVTNAYAEYGPETAEGAASVQASPARATSARATSNAPMEGYAGGDQE